MPHYMVAQVKVNDDGWVAEYAARVSDIIHRHGGRYLSRSGNITNLEGEDESLDLVALVEFPDLASIKAFMADPEYQPFAENRKAGALTRLLAIDSSDAMGAIDYLA
jgi:uncharacterized protein (DUF1330 family)